MEWHLATALEQIADIVPERLALINKDSQRTWREYEDRAARLADVLGQNGVGRDGKVGLYMHNSNEYMESHFATLKLSASPININYRYRESELIHILDNADAEALIFHETYRDVVVGIVEKCPKLKCLIQVSLLDSAEALMHGALRYEEALANATPAKRVARSTNDLYMLYTGGTTGLPKGVMYTNGGLCQHLVSSNSKMGFPSPETMEGFAESIENGIAKNRLPISFVGAPLMHGTGMWVGCLGPHLAGGTVVTISSLGFDPGAIWDLVEKHRVTTITIVGDAFAKPLLQTLDDAEAAGKPIDVSSLRLIISAGVMWSQEVKDGLLRHSNFILIDAMGSSEAAMGSSVTTRESSVVTGKFKMNPGVRILSEEGYLLEPGSSEVGILVTPGQMIGYYKDPEKTKETIREIDGVRYIISGDYATYEPDGSIRLLGRGSSCINTGGEKVFPEEVEEAVKLHPQVVDCLVVGRPDKRFGERIVAVVSVSGDVDAAELILHTKEKISGYKAPKEVFFADEVQRMPNGKADHKWAMDYVADRSDNA